MSDHGIGARLRMWRTAERLSWSDLAQLLEATPLEIGRIERCDWTPSDEQMLKLRALGFEVTP